MSSPQTPSTVIPAKRESRCVEGIWIPALCFATAGMTILRIVPDFFRTLVSRLTVPA
jgi:hypothetical protein